MYGTFPTLGLGCYSLLEFQKLHTPGILCRETTQHTDKETFKT